MEPVRELLSWYDRQRRDLPWRRTRDPYRVWLSEIMLQQTRVATALPYYERFVTRFPDVKSLAEADLDEVLALWSGLGYYRRARQLHAAARQVEDAGGSFPQASENLLELPGVGPYTAAAVASICFDEVVPVMDGNVERVTARRLALREDPKRASTRRRLVAAAADLLDPQRPGDSNQALMELGATVCTPRAPRCRDCPLAAGCLGRAEPESYPQPKTKRAPVEVTRIVALVRRRGRVLLYRRGDDEELMAGMWELPQVEAAEASEGREAAQQLAERYGGTWRLGDELGTVRHGITHRAITLRVHWAELSSGDQVADGVGRPEPAWVDLRSGDMERFATSSMVAKVLDLLDA